jgi:hypothetical protein
MGQFFAAQIRQNEFRILYEPPVIPLEAAWMFHIIQVLLVIVGLVGEDKPETTDGRIAHAQAGFLLGAALSMFPMKKSEEVISIFLSTMPTAGSRPISRIGAV